MFDLVQKQADIFQALLSHKTLERVNIKSYRKMQLAGEIDFSTVYTEARGGRSGAGLLVEMPTARCPRPNVSGPVLDWVFPVLVVENPTMNLEPQLGTGLSAEELAQIVLDLLHLFADDESGTLCADGEPVKSTDEFPGCVCYRVFFKIVGKTAQTPRVGNLTIAITTDTATITSSTVDAEIFYTLDGSFPGKTGSPTAQFYENPVPVQSGDVIRAVGYAADKINSAVTRKVAP